MDMSDYESVGEFWRKHVPAYQSRSLRPLHSRFPYSDVRRAAKLSRGISARRSNNRIANYVDDAEIARVRSRLHVEGRKPKDCSIRFGVRKDGHGYSGERGDFCLAAGVYAFGTLTLFYRSIELIGGFGYDLVLIDHVCRELEIEPKFIEIWAVKAFVFALKGNSNEKLYPKLQEVFRERVSSPVKRGPVKEVPDMPRARRVRRR
jgi:hypothetical protein